MRPPRKPLPRGGVFSFTDTLSSSNFRSPLRDQRLVALVKGLIRPMKIAVGRFGSKIGRTRFARGASAKTLTGIDLDQNAGRVLVKSFVDFGAGAWTLLA